MSDRQLRLEKELRFAQRVQMALLPQELPKRLKGVDVAWHFDPARELGGDIYDFLSPEPHTLVVSVGDVSGKGVPAALYSAFVGELVRGGRSGAASRRAAARPVSCSTAMNRILHERQLEEYYCTLCYAMFDLRRRQVTFANSGYRFRCATAAARRRSCRCRVSRSDRLPARPTTRSQSSCRPATSSS